MENENKKMVEQYEERVAREGKDREKRGTVMLLGNREYYFKFLQNEHRDMVGRTEKGLVEHMLKKVIVGDYDDLQPEEPESKRRMFVNKELRDKADERAKANGFSNISEMINRIIKKEGYEQPRKKFGNRAFAFKQIGEDEIDVNEMNGGNKEE